MLVLNEVLHRHFIIGNRISLKVMHLIYNTTHVPKFSLNVPQTSIFKLKFLKMTLKY